MTHAKTQRRKGRDGTPCRPGGIRAEINEHRSAVDKHRAARSAAPTLFFASSCLRVRKCFAPLRLCVRFFLLCVALVVLTAQPVRAHCDPRGDVYPTVTVDGDRFVIYFANNSETRWNLAGWGCRNYSYDYYEESWQNLYRTIIGIDGKLIESRKRIYRVPPPPRESEWLQKFTRSLTVVGAEEFHPIWFDDYPLDVGSITEYGEQLICHVSGMCDPDELDKPFPFYFALINPLTGIVRAAKIGNPFHIYYFAIASEIRIIDGKAYMAWGWDGQMRHTAVPRELQPYPPKSGNWVYEDKIAYRYACRLVLSRWDMKSDRVEHFFLPGRIDWNTHLSMNALGDKLLIAWHVGNPPYPESNSKIQTSLVSIPGISHQPQLFPLLDFARQEQHSTLSN